MPEDFKWATRTLPRFRLVPYVLCVTAGLLLALYQTPSMQKLDEIVQASFHIVLLLGAIMAVVGVIWQRERIEQAGLLVLVGPLLAYAVILIKTAVEAERPSMYATGAIGCLFLSFAGLVMVTVLDIHREIKRAEDAMRLAAERGEQWSR